jgi:fucose 4-O-acetylase-like acetyltransferase
VTLGTRHSGGSRIAWVDYAKAVGIVLVVLGHSVRGVERSSGQTLDTFWTSLDHFIYAFHIPLFFTLAGLVSSKMKHVSLSKFSADMWWGLALPYVLWSAIWVGLKTSLPGMTNASVTWADLFGIGLYPIEHFWFLYHLFFVRLFWFAAAKIASPINQKRLLFAFLGLFVALDAMGSRLEFWSVLAMNTFMFGIGLIFLQLQPQSDFSAAKQFKLAMVSAGVLACVFVLIELGPGGMAGWSYDATFQRSVWAVLRIFAAMAGTMMIIFAVRTWPPPTRSFARAFAFLGEASLVIYMTHTLFMAPLRSLLLMQGFAGTAPLVAVVAFVGLALPAIGYYALLRAGAVSRIPMAQYLGFGKAKNSSYMR